MSRCGRKKAEAAARVCVPHGGVHINGAYIDGSIGVVAWLHEHSLERVDGHYRDAVDRDAGEDWLYRTYIR